MIRNVALADAVRKGVKRIFQMQQNRDRAAECNGDRGLADDR
jgi:hypothetical protein